MSRPGLWALGAAALALSCGGGGPTGVPAPVATTPEFRDGWTGQSVAATITPANPEVGAVVAVRAPGYLLREARFGGQPFFLWLGDESYVRALVYSPGRLIKWTVTQVAVDLQIPDAEARFRDAAGAIERAAGLRLTLAGPGAQVTVRLDPGDPAFVSPDVNGFTRVFGQGDVVVRAEIVFRSVDAAVGRNLFRNNLLLHELGHAVGLNHVDDPRAVMIAFAPAGPLDFNLNEQVALRLMYTHRAPGNLAPDREPGLGAAALRPFVIVHVDG